MRRNNMWLHLLRAINQCIRTYYYNYYFDYYYTYYVLEKESVKSFYLLNEI